MVQVRVPLKAVVQGFVVVIVVKLYEIVLLLVAIVYLNHYLNYQRTLVETHLMVVMRD